MPGGIGAVAMNTVVAQRAADRNAIVAFSGGSLLNIAQGKFGKCTENDVKWLAAVGTDYGSISVGKNAPWKNLAELAAALKADPSKVPMGGGGTVGSQDWTKAALFAKKVGRRSQGHALGVLRGQRRSHDRPHGRPHPRDVRRHVRRRAAGRGRQHPHARGLCRQARRWASSAGVPTAKEQGYDVQWPIIRGFYTGPKVSDADFKAWPDAVQEDDRVEGIRRRCARSAACSPSTSRAPNSTRS